MKNKATRLLAIEKIINNYKIRNQEQLMNRLRKKGYYCTQATLSRDLKFLRVSKIADNQGAYVYILPGQKDDFLQTVNRGKLPLSGFLSLDFAQNLALIRTYPGYANSIAYLIDRAEKYEIQGTIAGDDTILLIPRDGVSKEDVKNCLILIFPELEDRIG
jgi:transcriptional regulator of arginine metabolism